MKAPLEDPKYVPQHPPIDGGVPDVVAKWGPRSQLRWFERFLGELKPQKHDYWQRFYCSSEQHRGQCCDSCIEDRNEGYDAGEDWCCCQALRARDAE